MKSPLLAAVFGIVGCWIFSLQAWAGEPSCRTGGVATADAFILMNPMYAMYFGDLEDYLEENNAKFRPGGDAVRCAAALSRAFMGSALQLYDPADVKRKQELDTEMRARGVNPGPQQATGSSMMYGMSLQLARMARVLPAAAAGNFGPMNTPTNEIEQMQIFAESMFRQFMQDPSMRSVFAQVEPLIRQAAQFDHYLVRQAAQRLANAP